MQAEEQESDEIEEGSPKDGRAGRQNARRHDRGNRIGGVMKPVEEVENEGDGDEANEQAYGSRIHSAVPAAVQVCSRTTPWISSQTSSKLSITCSR